MEFSLSGLISGLIFSVVGIAVLRHGKKQVEYDRIFVGLALMVYPYFTSGPWIDWVLGVALCAIAYFRPVEL